LIFKNSGSAGTVPTHTAMSFITRFVLASFLLCAVPAQNDSLPFPKTFGDPRSCPMSKEVYRFEVLPGGGWDNLRNLHMGEVSAMNYSKCKTSDDGKYLIPDNVLL